MQYIYNTLLIIIEKILPLMGIFSKKTRLFVEGRKNVWKQIERNVDKSSKYLWIHAASLGEYEQGVPLMECLKQKYPDKKLLLTFFSPSGYEIKKNNTIADLTLYLPNDTLSNVKRFLSAVPIEAAFFIKYEFWANYLTELHRRNIPIYLISGIFREQHFFFRWYGAWHRTLLKKITHFFVQNEVSKQLLNQIGINNVTVNGDTRFDRVAQIVAHSAPLDFVERFKNNFPTIVFGSSWKHDEAVYLPYINHSKGIKFIIAPHNINNDEIINLQNKITKKTTTYTQHSDDDLTSAEVLIINTIGLLTRVYASADVAFVGGGFNTGLHNILEPAAYGCAVVIGNKKYKKFQEANDLIALGGCFPVANTVQLQTIFDDLINNKNKRQKVKEINQKFVKKNSDAVKTIIDYLAKHLSS